MRKFTRPDFPQLEEELLRAGISPVRAVRVVAELEDHYEDLVAESVRNGADPAAAEQCAARALGKLEYVSAAMREQPQLKSWAGRWPRLALLVYPLACAVALPAAPLIAGAQNAAQVGRWLACIFLGAIVTATMFLVLQLSITLS